MSAQEMKEKLIPVLRVMAVKELGPLDEFGGEIVKRCKDRLASLLPLSSEEAEFIRLLRDEGKIEPALLTSDSPMQAIIAEHPALKWRVFQGRERR